MPKILYIMLKSTVLMLEIPLHKYVYTVSRMHGYSAECAINKYGKV